MASSDSDDLANIYQKKTPLEHILLRPDTYVGSIEPDEAKLWVFNSEKNEMEYRQIRYVPGLYKIFDEILVNAVDNYQRDKKMNRIEVNIDKEAGSISVMNNGKGIPVAMHPEHGVYIPEMIFGQLLTSSNYDDTKKKVTGGRNGYGAKLANVFSHTFVVECADSERRKELSVTWKKNMTTKSEAKVKMYTKGSDFTRVTFFPDFPRFGMTGFDQDILDLFTKRVYDMSGITRAGVKVYINGTLVPVKTFRDYMDLYLKNSDKPKLFETVSDRWQIGFTFSEGLFNQVSFVNSICTSKGGTHVTYVTDQLIAEIQALIKKKHKKVTVKNGQVKQHLWVFINCLIENPAFDSQTKETMTLKRSNFGSTCDISDQFKKDLIKSGVIDNVLTYANAKAAIDMGKGVAKKAGRPDIVKLDDATMAGKGKHAQNCTIILTEGDSAKNLAKAGIDVVGKQFYGCYPLRGKLLNVREATTKQLSENKELRELLEITGLKPKRIYNDLSELRYGGIMIMTDQDVDGSHIKGLIINLIGFYWPDLLKHYGFVTEFITPIVKAKKGSSVQPFYTIPEFNEWQSGMTESERKSWSYKYYKGLGTSDSKEAQEYFSELTRHQIYFQWNDEECTNSIDLAFNKKRANDRKDWLARMDPDVCLKPDGQNVTYSDFINKEFILFSQYDNYRSIPNAIDGLKPGQRKILWACFKRRLTKELKVAALCGYVSEQSNYHHGEVSLAGTIVNMAQNFCGSNNLNLLHPQGQFGSRAQGGKNAASARYITTFLTPPAWSLFPEGDKMIYSYINEEGKSIEPPYYVPTIPLSLVNGAQGIGTGWSTEVPMFNPIEILEMYEKRIENNLEEFPDADNLQPWFRGYIGDITKVKDQVYESKGKIERIDDQTISITELPIKKWTEDYIKYLMELKKAGEITDFVDNSTEHKINFEITGDAEKFDKFERSGLVAKFKLSAPVNMTNMVMFNHERVIKKYESVLEILNEHWIIKNEYMIKRHTYLITELKCKDLRAQNIARFLGMVCDGAIEMRNRPLKELGADVARHKFTTETEFKNMQWKNDTLGKVEKST